MQFIIRLLQRYVDVSEFGSYLVVVYRVTQKVSDLGLVDLDLECSNSLLGQ